MPVDEASGVYTPNPWMHPVPPQVKVGNRPNFISYEDQITGQALAAAMTETPDQIRAIKPPLPINPFPPRFGYRQGALGIRDIVHLDDLFQQYDFSGKQSGYQGTSYPSLNQF